jgi:transcriptional regulator with XRE-family HTH domain
MAGSDQVVRLMFGAALRAERTRAGMSLRELGRAVHYDHSRLSRAENGEHLPALGYVRSIDAALGTGDLLATLRRLAEQPGPPQPDLEMGAVAGGQDDPQPATVELHLPDGRVMRVSISRRQLGELLAAGGALAMVRKGLFNTDETHRLRRALDRPRDVDTRVAGYFARLLEEHYTADKMLGPADLVPAAHAEIATVDRLRRDAQPDVRRLLTSVQCQYAEFLGWLYQDVGDSNTAMYYSDRATELAQTSGDKQMIAYLLIRKSNIAYRAGDAIRAIELAAAAHHDHDGIDPKILALACQQEARSWAITGDYDHCQPKLDQAADHLTHAGPEATPGTPTYIHHYGTDVLEDQAATCYRDLGRTERAITIFQRKIDELPHGHDRDRGYRMAKLAVAYAHNHQPRPAASLGLQALTLARHTGSARTESELQPLAGQLSRWRTQPDVATFIDALRTPRT